MTRPSGWLLAAVTLALFSLWSCAFLGIDRLLVKPGVPGGVFDWWEMIVVRYGLIALCTAAYAFGVRGRESIALLRRHPVRVFVLAAMMVPGYNVFLYYAQQHGVPPAIAALSTAAAPLFMMVLGSTFLGERIGPAKVVGFVVAAVGLVIVASAKDLGPGRASYALLIVIALGAPACWSVYSTVLKPMLVRESPVLVLFVALSLTGLPLWLFVDADLWGRARGLTASQWGIVGYLVVPSAVLAFPLWNWLLKHLPASTVGFTVFLNTPLTFLFAFVLLGTRPSPVDLVGAAVVLTGVGIVVRGGRRAARLPADSA